MLHLAVADPDLELRGRPGFVLLAPPAFLPEKSNETDFSGWNVDPIRERVKIDPRCWDGV